MNFTQFARLQDFLNAYAEACYNVAGADDYNEDPENKDHMIDVSEDRARQEEIEKQCSEQGFLISWEGGRVVLSMETEY